MIMQVNKYTYLIHRVEYPLERGYRMEPKLLPSWVYITVTQKGNSKWLTVHSRLHVNEEVRLSPDYSSCFNDRDIIKDLTPNIIRRFGL
jgi:hypothetical protein